jgi:hypothetical protein
MQEIIDILGRAEDEKQAMFREIAHHLDEVRR